MMTQLQQIQTELTETPAFDRKAVITDIALLLQHIVRKGRAPQAASQVSHCEWAILYLIHKLKRAQQDLPSGEELRDILHAQYETNFQPHFDSQFGFEDGEHHASGLELQKLLYSAAYQRFQKQRMVTRVAAFKPVVIQAIDLFNIIEKKSRTKVNVEALNQINFPVLATDVQGVTGVQCGAEVSEKLKGYKNTLNERLLKELLLKRELSEKLLAKKEQLSFSFKNSFKKIMFYFFLCFSPFTAAESSAVAEGNMTGNTGNKIEAINELREKLDDQTFTLDDLKKWQKEKAGTLNAHRHHALFAWTEKTKRKDNTDTMNIIKHYTALMEAPVSVVKTGGRRPG